MTIRQPDAIDKWHIPLDRGAPSASDGNKMPSGTIFAAILEFRSIRTSRGLPPENGFTGAFLLK
jgi:hypothetical protein